MSAAHYPNHCQGWSLCGLSRVERWAKVEIPANPSRCELEKEEGKGNLLVPGGKAFVLIHSSYVYGRGEGRKGKTLSQHFFPLLSSFLSFAPISSPIGVGEEGSYFD